MERNHGVRRVAGWVLGFALAASAAQSAGAEEKVYSVQRTISSGGDVTIDMPDRKLMQVDVMIRRIDPQYTNCHITVGLKGGEFLEDGKHAQVDSQDFHVLHFTGNQKWNKERDLQVKVHNGDVHIREVVVHFE